MIGNINLGIWAWVVAVAAVARNKHSVPHLKIILSKTFFIISWLPWCWGPSCRSGERSQQHLCLVCRGVRATCCTALQVSGKIKNDQEKADPPSLMYVSTGLMPATTTLTITWSSPTSGTGTLPSTWLNISLTLHGPYGSSIWHALNLENFRPPKSLNSDSPHDGHVQCLLTKTIEAICAIMSISNNLRCHESFKNNLRYHKNFKSPEQCNRVGVARTRQPEKELVYRSSSWGWLSTSWAGCKRDWPITRYWDNYPPTMWAGGGWIAMFAIACGEEVTEQNHGREERGNELTCLRGNNLTCSTYWGTGYIACWGGCWFMAGVIIFWKWHRIKIIIDQVGSVVRVREGKKMSSFWG